MPDTYLCLMRHAKSSWANGDLSDHQRPLNERGREAAPLIGGVLAARNYAPDIIWSSDARRTRETAMCLIRAIPGAQSVTYNSDFYHASAQQVISICDKTPFPDGQNLMLLGHNPGWAELFFYLSGKSYDFPTAACAVFRAKVTLEADWLRPVNWELVDFLVPKALA
jgi:phosphohistidine phosphatase